ncbi:MAG: hypothetical protein AAF654_06680 [Myxococcota bacterium]
MSKSRWYMPDAESVHSQLAFIRSELDAGSAHRMQELFPEGYLFSYVRRAWD